MKYKHHYNCRKKGGFTIIESLVYIFLTTIILAQGINLYVSLYKAYIDKVTISSKYNNYQNFFVNIDSIIDKGEYEKVIAQDNSILFFQKDNNGELDKRINSYGGNVVVKYMNDSNNINVMIEDIDCLEVKNKGKLIYIILHDKDGKEFIKCI